MEPDSSLVLSFVRMCEIPLSSSKGGEGWRWPKSSKGQNFSASVAYLALGSDFTSHLAFVIS